MAPRDPAAPLRILFYGQFIPLHGIETIIEAAGSMQSEEVDWVLIGRGQEEVRIRDRLDRHRLPRLQWIPWVPYDRLRAEIAAADICLGIFGSQRQGGTGDTEQGVSDPVGRPPVDHQGFPGDP